MPTCWRCVSNCDPLPSTSPIRLSISGERSSRCSTCSGFAESQARIAATITGMPSITGYSRRHASSAQERMPSRRSSSSSRMSEETVSAPGRQPGQVGRGVRKWRPRPRRQPPIITVRQPGGRILPTGPGMGATQLVCAVMSFTRAAGRLPVSTVVEPRDTMPGPAGTQPGSTQGAEVSERRAAGWLPISTVNSPLMRARGRPGWADGGGTGAGGGSGAGAGGEAGMGGRRRHWRGRMDRRVAVRRVLLDHVAEAGGAGHEANVMLDFVAEEAVERIEKDDAGRMRLRYFVRGEKLDGEWTAFDQEGWVAQRGTFKEGVLDGELLQYDADGRVAASLPYRMGKLDGEARYFDRGRLQLSMAFTNGLQDGPTTVFGENGKPTTQAEYHAGKLHGLSVWYRPDGKPLRTSEFADGELDGETGGYDAG